MEIRGGEKLPGLIPNEELGLKVLLNSKISVLNACLGCDNSLCREAGGGVTLSWSCPSWGHSHHQGTGQHLGGQWPQWECQSFGGTKVLQASSVSLKFAPLKSPNLGKHGKFPNPEKHPAVWPGTLPSWQCHSSCLFVSSDCCSLFNWCSEPALPWICNAALPKASSWSDFPHLALTLVTFPLSFHIPTRLHGLDTAPGDNSLLSDISSDLNWSQWQNTIFWKPKKEPAELEAFLHPFARFHGVNSNAWLLWLPWKNQSLRDGQGIPICRDFWSPEACSAPAKDSRKGFR